MPKVASPIVPGSTSTYGVDDVDVRGGFSSVATLAARDALPAAARKRGMTVRVTDDATAANNAEWVYTGGVDTADNSLWRRKSDKARVNARDYGARFDGNTGWRAANNSALSDGPAFLASFGGVSGGVFNFDVGEMQVSATATVPANQTWDGGGYGTIINAGFLSGSGHSGPLLNMGANGNIRLSNLYLTQAGGDALFCDTTGGVDPSNPFNIALENLFLRFNEGDGAHLGNVYNLIGRSIEATDNEGWGLNFPGFHTSLHLSETQTSRNALGGVRYHDTCYSSDIVSGSDDNEGPAKMLSSIRGLLIAAAGFERCLEGIRLEASDSIGGFFGDIRGVTLLNPTGFETDEDAPSLVHAKSQDGRLIDFSIVDPAEGSSPSGVSIRLDGNVRARLIGNAGLMGSIELLNGATLNQLLNTVPGTNKLPYFDTPGTATTTDFTALARTLVGASTSAAMRLVLEIAAVDNAFTATQTFTNNDPIILKGGQPNIQFRDGANSILSIFGYRPDIAANSMVLYSGLIGGGLSHRLTDNRFKNTGYISGARIGAGIDDPAATGHFKLTTNQNLIMSFNVTGALPGYAGMAAMDDAGTGYVPLGFYGSDIRLAGGPVRLPGISTTASGANAFIDNADGNNILRSTSSLKYKREVEPIDPARVDAVLDAVSAVWYRSTSEHDPADWGFYGVIAEALAEVAPQLVVWSYQEDQYEEVEIEERQIVQAMEEVEEACSEVEIIDGQPVLSRKTRLVSKPKVIHQPVVDETGAPVMQEVPALTATGKPKMKDGQPVMTLQPATWPVPVMIEQVTKRIERRVKPGEQKRPDGVYYDRLSVFLLNRVQRLISEVQAIKGAA